MVVCAARCIVKSVSDKVTERFRRIWRSDFPQNKFFSSAIERGLLMHRSLVQLQPYLQIQEGRDDDDSLTINLRLRKELRDGTNKALRHPGKGNLDGFNQSMGAAP